MAPASDSLSVKESDGYCSCIFLHFGCGKGTQWEPFADINMALLLSRLTAEVSGETHPFAVAIGTASKHLRYQTCS